MTKALKVYLIVTIIAGFSFGVAYVLNNTKYGLRLHAISPTNCVGSTACVPPVALEYRTYWLGFPLVHTTDLYSFDTSQPSQLQTNLTNYKRMAWNYFLTVGIAEIAVVIIILVRRHAHTRH